jgi:putative transposase
MRRAYQKRSGKKSSRPIASEALQMMLDRDELIRQLQQSVHSFGVEVGLLVATQLLGDEVRSKCGERHERSAERVGHRYGTQRGVITIAGQKLPVKRPRVRAAHREVELDTYRLLQRDDAMPEAALQRMVRGVSTRDYEEVVDVAADGFGVARSSVSRAFIEASRAEVQQLAERRFDGVRFPVILIDGIDYAGAMMVVVLGVQNDGSKRMLGFREGASENAEVCKALIEELCDRGLCRDQPTLFVLDGSKALRKAVIDVWGRLAIIQRCQIHKKRNIQAHVPDRHWEEIRRRINEAYHETDYPRALRILKNTAALLDRISPDAAGSLREGLEETLTLTRLGVPAELFVHLSSTNLSESSLSTARKVSRNVKRWRDGDMRRRWCAAGLLVAEKKFRRVKGYRHMPQLIAAIDRAVTEHNAVRKTA